MNSLCSIEGLFFRCCIKLVVVNGALLLPPHEMLTLQTLQVDVGLLSFSNLKYFHTADILAVGTQSTFLHLSCISAQIVLSLYIGLSFVYIVLWFMLNIADTNQVKNTLISPDTDL